MSREIWVDVKVVNPQEPKRSMVIRALVDNGSVDSAMPASGLRKLGIRPRGVETYEAWAGKRHRRPWGEADFHIQGRFGTTRLTFEPDTEVPTVGALALETLGFDIDIPAGRLKPVRRLGRGPLRRATTLLRSRGRV